MDRALIPLRHPGVRGRDPAPWSAQALPSHPWQLTQTKCSQPPLQLSLCCPLTPPRHLPIPSQPTRIGPGGTL